jgi:hypothetical protein
MPRSFSLQRSSFSLWLLVAQEALCSSAPSSRPFLQHSRSGWAAERSWGAHRTAEHDRPADNRNTEQRRVRPQRRCPCPRRANQRRKCVPAIGRALKRARYYHPSLMKQHRASWYNVPAGALYGADGATRTHDQRFRRPLRPSKIIGETLALMIFRIVTLHHC